MKNSKRVFGILLIEGNGKGKTHLSIYRTESGFNNALRRALKSEKYVYCEPFSETNEEKLKKTAETMKKTINLPVNSHRKCIH